MPTKKPNIVILWGDDIGIWNISHFSRGMMGYRTPNIDRVAEEGVTFTDYYSQQSCTAGCHKTRSSMSVAPGIFRGKPSHGSVPPPSSSVKARRSTYLSTRATTGRATPTPLPAVRVYRSIRPDKIRDYHRRAEPRRRYRRPRR